LSNNRYIYISISTNTENSLIRGAWSYGVPGRWFPSTISKRKALRPPGRAPFYWPHPGPLQRRGSYCSFYCIVKIW